jgi:hypothetical protein
VIVAIMAVMAVMAVMVGRWGGGEVGTWGEEKDWLHEQKHLSDVRRGQGAPSHKIRIQPLLYSRSERHVFDWEI